MLATTKLPINQLLLPKKMSNNFEKLIIGSAHEGAEGMFEQSNSEEALDDETLQMKRLERGIFPDAQVRLESTLTELGYEQVRELSEDITYPSVDQWVEHRIRHNRGTKFFPTFVKNQEGKFFFCKAQINDRPDALAGLTHEAEILSALPPEVSAPKLIQYVEPSSEKSALIITEAISINEATVAPSEHWNEGHIVSAIDQIKALENTQPSSESARDYTEPVLDLLQRSKLPSELSDRIRLIVEQYQPHAKSVFVHGDAAIKNILASTPDQEAKVHFVDWELAGEGFLGQDAAKL